MKFLTNGLRNIGVLLALTVAMLLTNYLNVSANSYAKTSLTTSKTRTILPDVRSMNFPTRSAMLGRTQEPSMQLTASRNQFTDFTDLKTLRLSETNPRFAYDSAEQTREALNFSESSTTFTFQNSRTIEAPNLKTFYANPIWKTARQFSANGRARNLPTFVQLPETNLRILQIVPLTQSSTRASSGFAVGVTSVRWLKPKSNWRESSPFSTAEQAIFAANWTARLSESERLKVPLNDLTNSNPANLPKKCMSQTSAKQFRENPQKQSKDS